VTTHNDNVEIHERDSVRVSMYTGRSYKDAKSGMIWEGDVVKYKNEEYIITYNNISTSWMLAKAGQPPYIPLQNVVNQLTKVRGK